MKISGFFNYYFGSYDQIDFVKIMFAVLFTGFFKVFVLFSGYNFFGIENFEKQEE